MKRDLADDEVGEVWCLTRQNLRGYWRNPKATAAAYPEGRDANGLGWFRTGDAGCMKDGYKCPTSIDRIGAIPRNPSEKVLKTQLREPVWKGKARLVN